MCRSQDQVHWRMYKIVHTLHAPTCLQIINFYWNPNSIQWVTILTSKINVQNIDNGFCQISSTSRAIDVINQAPLQTPYQTLSLELLFFHESLKLIKLWSKQFYPYLCLTGPARKSDIIHFQGYRRDQSSTATNTVPNPFFGAIIFPWVSKIDQVMIKTVLSILMPDRSSSEIAWSVLQRRLCTKNDSQLICTWYEVSIDVGDS